MAENKIKVKNNKIALEAPFFEKVEFVNSPSVHVPILTQFSSQFYCKIAVRISEGSPTM